MTLRGLQTITQQLENQDKTEQECEKLKKIPLDVATKQHERKASASISSDDLKAANLTRFNLMIEKMVLDEKRLAELDSLGKMRKHTLADRNAAKSRSQNNPMKVADVCL